MTKEQLAEVLRKHKLWLEGIEGGERANLQGANLIAADFRGANLIAANLQGTNLAYANLQGTNLAYANLRGAGLQEANLRDANLRGADLQGADLAYANLRGADIDYSCWPLWCGSFNVKVDRKIAVQLLYHLLKLDIDDEEDRKALYTPELIRLANEFHLVSECGKIQEVTTCEND